MRLFNTLLSILVPTLALACFGAELRVGVPPDAGLQTYTAYSVGYYVEEKTGIAPRFVEVADGESAILNGEIDLWLEVGEDSLPRGVEERTGAAVEGLGKVTFWLNPEVLDDLRFTTVERALARASSFLTSEQFNENAMGDNPRKSARKAAVKSD
ncbi:MAG: hypothetical protein C0608_07265 [Deltaproteobacteria bacterium]|nr:MAG: hypothetical protein C0608_07265 [Deltaproteobacteria bacterium]